MTVFVVDAVLVFLGECPESHLTGLPFESSSAGTTNFPLRTHSCGDDDGVFDTHTDVVLHDDAPEVDAQVGQGGDAFPVVVVIHCAVRAHLVGVAGHEATGCPESKLVAAAEAAVAVCS